MREVKNWHLPWRQPSCMFSTHSKHILQRNNSANVNEISPFPNSFIISITSYKDLPISASLKVQGSSYKVEQSPSSKTSFPASHDVTKLRNQKLEFSRWNSTSLYLIYTSHPNAIKVVALPSHCMIHSWTLFCLESLGLHLCFSEDMTLKNVRNQVC